MSKEDDSYVDNKFSSKVVLGPVVSRKDIAIRNNLKSRKYSDNQDIFQSESSMIKPVLGPEKVMNIRSNNTEQLNHNSQKFKKPVVYRKSPNNEFSRA